MTTLDATGRSRQEQGTGLRFPEPQPAAWATGPARTPSSAPASSERCFDSRFVTPCSPLQLFPPDDG